VNLKPLQQKNINEIIHNFTPNWFTLNMGTGLAFLTMHNIVKNLFFAQTIIIEAFWIIDMLFFLLFSSLLVLRIIKFPSSIKPLLHHPVQSMFLGAIPMAMVPIIEGFVLFGPTFFGNTSLQIALYLWYLDVALAIIIGLFIPYFMFTIQKNHTLQNMTAVWLLPIVASEVAASAGGLLVSHYSGFTAEIMLFISYVLWGLSVPLAMSVLVILFLRLVTHKLPHKDMAVTSWLTLGPLGTGTLSLLLLGSASKTVLMHTELSYLSNYLQAFGLIIGLLIWGYGLWWYAMSWVITLKFFKEGLPFSMGWWAFTFPVGVYTAATFQIWHLVQFRFFEVLAIIFSIQLVIFWLIIFSKTIKGIYSGALFYAPCINELDINSNLSQDNIKLEKFHDKTN